MVAALVVGLSACSPSRSQPPPFGFMTSSGQAQRALEARFLELPDTTRLREAHRELTRAPHPAGSPRDRELAEWTAARFREAGLQDVAITTHDVLLPRPLQIRVEMTRPAPWVASTREDAVEGDADTAIDAAAVGLPYHAYSASGEVSGPVVYAGSGEAANYDWLASRGITVRNRIVLVRTTGPRSYRGSKVLIAQERGAAGIIMFPEDDVGETPTAAAYPKGPAGPEARIERGGIAYDFRVPGDPLTPGWASVPGARRIAPVDAVSLPRIVSVPISAKDARAILQTLEGPSPPSWWREAHATERRAGPGAAAVKLTVRMDDRVRPVWTVTGLLRGTEWPDEMTIVGNHRDAWVYGGVDPSSGSAVVIELARALGRLVQGGWRPRRSLLFASWDAEELALTSSTEWGEQHQDWLRERAIAYLNVDSAASGPRFVAGAVPSLMRLIGDAADAVRDPSSGMSVGALARRSAAADRGVAAAPSDDVAEDRLGGGSDYAVFLNYLGIPAADLAFDGPYGVYHSVYDTHAFVSRIADPGFSYQAALVRVLGVAVLRLLQADSIPLDPVATASHLRGFIREIEDRTRDTGRAADLSPVTTAALEFERAATAYAAARDTALHAGDRQATIELNRRLLGLERAFTDPAGLPGRPWYRHLLHAPRPDYAPEVLPAIADALERDDAASIPAEVARVAAALRRAAARLEGR